MLFWYTKIPVFSHPQKLNINYVTCDSLVTDDTYK